MSPEHFIMWANREALAYLQATAPTEKTVFLREQLPRADKGMREKYGEPIQPRLAPQRLVRLRVELARVACPAGASNG
jgi:hypothetical protein